MCMLLVEFGRQVAGDAVLIWRGITPCSCAADTPAQQTRHFGLNVMVVVPFRFLQFFKSKGTDVVKL